MASLLAGIFTALFWFIHPDAGLTNMAARLTGRWEFAYVLFVGVLVLTLFGLIGLYVRQLEKAKAIGFIGFFLAFIGTAIFIGAGIFDGFVSPILAQSGATQFLLDAKGALLTHLSPLFIFGGLSFAIGFILFGITIIRTKIFPRWTGILLILSAPILGLSPLMPAMARTWGSVVFGLTIATLGFKLWSDKE